MVLMEYQNLGNRDTRLKIGRYEDFKNWPDDPDDYVYPQNNEKSFNIWKKYFTRLPKFSQTGVRQNYVNYRLLDFRP